MTFLDRGLEGNSPPALCETSAANSNKDTIGNKQEVLLNFQNLLHGRTAVSCATGYYTQVR